MLLQLDSRGLISIVGDVFRLRKTFFYSMRFNANGICTVGYRKESIFRYIFILPRTDRTTCGRRWGRWLFRVDSFLDIILLLPGMRGCCLGSVGLAVFQLVNNVYVFTVCSTSSGLVLKTAHALRQGESLVSLTGTSLQFSLPVQVDVSSIPDSLMWASAVWFLV